MTEIDDYSEINVSNFGMAWISKYGIYVDDMLKDTLDKINSYDN